MTIATAPITSPAQTLSPPAPRPDIVVPRGRFVSLTTRVDAESLLEPRIRITDDVDEFRSWFAVPGDRLAAGLDTIPAEHLPRGPWTRGDDFAPEDLGTEELEDLRRAANCYLFGHQPLVAHYREAITRFYAPFGAAFYTAGRVEIPAGATIRVDGFPAILDFDELVIRKGGQLDLGTAFRLAARSLVKTA